MNSDASDAGLGEQKAEVSEEEVSEEDDFSEKTFEVPNFKNTNHRPLQSMSPNTEPQSSPEHSNCKNVIRDLKAENEQLRSKLLALESRHLGVSISCLFYYYFKRLFRIFIVFPELVSQASTAAWMIDNIKERKRDRPPVSSTSSSEDESSSSTGSQKSLTDEYEEGNDPEEYEGDDGKTARPVSKFTLFFFYFSVLYFPCLAS